MMDRGVFLFIVLLASTAFGKDTLDISIHMSEQEWYPLGEDATLECFWSYSDTSNLDITKEELEWKTKSGSILKIEGCNPYGDHSFIYSNSEIDAERLGNETSCDQTPSSSKLIIRDFRVTDEGAFTCEVSIETFSRSNTVTIKAYADPEVSIIEIQTTADIRAPAEDMETDNTNSTATTAAPAEPQNLEVICAAIGAYPEPKRYEFYIEKNENRERIAQFERGHDAIMSRYNSTTQFWDTEVTYRLSPDKKYDQAVISCEVFLDSDTSTVSTPNSSPISIYHDATEVSIHIEPMIAVTGEQVTITCSSDGNPAPTYRVVPEVSDDGSTNPFYINNVQTTHQQGYQCVAIPPGGTSEEEYMYSSTEHLTVNYMNQPTATKSVSTVSKNNDVTLTCDVEGHPAPTTSWWKNGNRLSTARQYTINSADYEDSGTYECVASSTENRLEDLSASVQVNVQGACEAKMLDPMISSSQNEEFRYNMKIECLVTGKPDCTVSISHGGNLQASGSNGQTGDIYSVSYEDLEMFTEPVTFFCVADNSVGPARNVSLEIDDGQDICCKAPKTGGLSTGAVIGIILLVLVILVGIPVACYFVKKRNAQPKKKAPSEAEAAEPEKEGLNKDASSETSDASSLPPPPAEDHDHRLNSAHEMTTFSTNK